MKISVKDAIEKLLISPNISSRRPVYEKYDKNVQGNTVIERGQASAAVTACFRDFPELDNEKSKISVAVGTGGNSNFARISPRYAAEQSIIQALLQITCVGAEPLGATDCLNFGNPEKSEQMAELVEGISGVKKACEEFSIPIVSGNVSLYNESRGRSIPPSAMVAVFGRVDDPTGVPPVAFQQLDEEIFLVAGGGSLGGSEFLRVLDKEDTHLPEIDYAGINSWVKELRNLVQQKKISSACEVSQGGAIISLLRGCFQSNLGALLELDEREALETLFGEGGGVVISTKNPEEIQKAFGSIAKRIGKVAQGFALQVQFGKTNILHEDITAWNELWQGGMRVVV